MNKVICNILATICLVSLCSCSDDKLYVGSAGSSGGDVFDFSFVTEYESAGTRAYGTASHVDRLIYKIYKKNSDGEFEADTYFLGGNTCEVQEYDENGNAIEGKYVTIDNCGVIDGLPFSLRLVKNPNDNDKPEQEYKIVCWAQKKGVEYFDLTHFPDNISINYGNGAFANNSEDFDAFYCSHIFKASDQRIDITLKRPFAQLNIGTAGWDYEGFACIEPTGKIIKYSKMVINGVAKSFSPLDRKADGETANLANNVTYNWAPLPAYRYLADPTDLYKLTGIYADDHSTEEGYKGVFALKGVEEEMLRIALPKPKPKTDEAVEAVENNGNFGEYVEPDDGAYVYADYKSWKEYNALSTKYGHDELISHIFTETFKYLSMCYVLVPFDDSNETVGSKGHTVSIKFDCSDGEKKTADGSDNSDGTAAAADVAEYTGVFGDRNAFELDNVPVTVNHRTNIIATDGTGFFMNTNDLKVYIHTDTFADFYDHFHATDETWNDEEENKWDNDEYEWPDEDFDPNLRPQIDHPIFTDLGGQLQYLVAQKENLIRAYYYLDAAYDGRNKALKFRVSALKPIQLTGYTDYKYDFFIDNVQLAESDYTCTGDTRNGYDVMIRLDKLYNIVKDHDKVLDEDYQMYYYPVELEVKTILTRDDSARAKYREPENLNVTIRLYPLYDSYTFSENSEDDGKVIWDKFQTEGTPIGTSQYNWYKSETDYKNGVKTANYSAYGIWNGNKIEHNGLVVCSRHDGSAGNDRVATFGGRGDAGDQEDHIIFFGASSKVPASGIPTNHYVKFNVDKKCKITVKWGRDMDADNGSESNGGSVNDRKLIISWGQTENLEPKSGDDRYWAAYPLYDEKNTYKRTSSWGYNITESRIAKAVTTDNISGSTPVYIYEPTSATSIYWILVSPAE